MEDKLILVNGQNEITGYCEKMEAHRLGLLHRAFSIFIVDVESGELLIQKRAASKYHSGGLWTNACCSHPRKDEDVVQALQGRLQEELGLHVKEGSIASVSAVTNLEELLPNVFYECGSFQYLADFGDLKEHEIDRVFLFAVHRSKVNFNINPREAEEIRWVSFQELCSWYHQSPQQFTAWFKPAISCCVHSPQDGVNLFGIQLHTAASGYGSPPLTELIHPLEYDFFAALSAIDFTPL